MDRETTLIVLVVAVVATLAGLLGDRARRRAPLAGHALLPWHGLIFVGLTACVFMAVHLLALG